MHHEVLWIVCGTLYDTRQHDSLRTLRLALVSFVRVDLLRLVALLLRRVSSTIAAGHVTGRRSTTFVCHRGRGANASPASTAALGVHGAGHTPETVISRHKLGDGKGRRLRNPNEESGMIYRVCVFKSLAIAVVLGFCYLDLFVEPHRYTSPWFVAVWGPVTLLGVLTSGKRNRWLGTSRMHPILQAIFALLLISTALVTSFDRAISGKHWLIQVGWTWTTLVLYRGGLAWAWLHLKSRGRDESSL